MKLVGTMVQDSGKKREKPCIKKKKGNVPKRKTNPHAIEKKLGAILKHKHRAKKKKKGESSVQKKIETYTTPNCLYGSKKGEEKAKK